MHKNISVFLRDKFSFAFLQSKLKNSNIYCTPDIVLSLTNSITIPKLSRKGVLLCLRNDIESKLKETDVTFLRNKFSSYTEKDTCLPYDIPIFQRNAEINHFLLDLTNYKLVITDRLHCAIFCAITQTPCITFSNYNHKIKGIMEWLSNCQYIFLCESISCFDEILNKINSNPHTYALDMWDSSFQPLIDVFSRLVNN